VGVHGVLFGARALAGDAIPLSGDPDRAYLDLIEVGMRLARGHASS
jgi:hypothetical protein